MKYFDERPPKEKDCLPNRIVEANATRKKTSTENASIFVQVADRFQYVIVDAAKTRKSKQQKTDSTAGRTDDRPMRACLCGVSFANVFFFLLLCRMRDIRKVHKSLAVFSD